MGKSRIAQQVAGQVARAFDDGVWLVELSGHREKSAIVLAVADIFGLVLAADTAEAELIDHLFDRRVLLVFDCCEASVVAISELCVVLLKRCPHLRILTTSRQTLGIVGEGVLAILPLPTPREDHGTVLRGLFQYDAVRLFVERAATVMPDFEITASNQSAVAQICNTLEGLPLAIESAAGRLRVMTAEQILQRLTGRYRLMSLGNRAGPARHQTLSTCPGWSFDPCFASEQALWSRLAIFEGSFDLDAAESICSTIVLQQELVDLIAGLVEKSIVIPDVEGRVARYRLSETSRQYVMDRFGDDQTWDSLSRRHRDWFLVSTRNATDIATRGTSNAGRPAGLPTRIFAIRKERWSMGPASEYPRPVRPCLPGHAWTVVCIPGSMISSAG